MSVFTGKEKLKLGFGLMRLPKLEDGSIDVEQTSKMVDASSGDATSTDPE